jgi:hypothetical protein
MGYGTGREGEGMEGGWEGERAERLMTVLESVVTVGMRQVANSQSSVYSDFITQVSM